MAKESIFWTPFRTSFGANIGGASRRLFIVQSPVAFGKRLIVRGYRFTLRSGVVAAGTNFGVQLVRAVAPGAPGGGSPSAGVPLREGDAASNAAVFFDPDGATAITGAAGTESIIDGCGTSAPAITTCAPPTVMEYNLEASCRGSFGGIVINVGDALCLRQHQSFASQAQMICDGFVIWEEQ